MFASVRFEPSARGRHRANLVLTHDSFGGRRAVSLAGTAHRPPQALMGWRMRKRYDIDANGNGHIDAPASRDYVFPSGYTVDLNGCSSVSQDSAIVAYRWRWMGEETTSSDCRLAVSSISTGRYELGLTIVTADGRQVTVKENADLEDHLIVSIGDSIGSGEGNPVVRRTKSHGAFWADGAAGEARACHRSTAAGSSVAAQRIERVDHHSSVTFLHLACSGASIGTGNGDHGGLLHWYTGIEPESESESRWLPPQVEQLANLVCDGDCKRNRDRRIDALVISAGANDAGFGDVVSGCITTIDCRVKATRDDFYRNLALLPWRYEELATALEQFRIRRVFITEYPDPTTNEEGKPDEMVCSGEKTNVVKQILENAVAGLPVWWNVFRVCGISSNEARWARNTVVAKLNEAVRKAADKHGWTYVGGIANQFVGHGYPADRDRFVVRLVESAMRQGTVHGMLHPNGAGHDVYATRITRAIREGLGIR